MKLTDNQIQVVFSRYILGNNPMSTVIRGTIFNENNKINWQDAFENATIYMPELLSNETINKILDWKLTTV